MAWPIFRTKEGPSAGPALRFGAKDSGRRWMPPPLRVGNQPDDTDSRRCLWNVDGWSVQDPAYRLRDRTIEEAARMAAGQMYWQWHPIAGWIDIEEFLTDEERAWKHRPSFNHLLGWFVATHAKMTENEFSATFAPGPDEKDAAIAEALMALYRVKWRSTGMREVWSRVASWLAIAGTGFLQSRVDLSAGEWEDWVGQARLPLIGPDDQPVANEQDGGPVLVDVDGVPFAKDGTPQAVLRHEGLQITGKAHRERTGDIVVDVLSPLEVRGQWGPLPWWQQRRHRTLVYLTPQDIWERWKVEVEPDITDLPASNSSFLQRLLFGAGFYGHAGMPLTPAVTGAATATQVDGYAAVYSTWEAPTDTVEGMEETPDTPEGPGSAGGRLLVTTKSKVLTDGPRPYRCRTTSPIHGFEFVRLPGRPSGTTPIEMMLAPSKSYNHGARQILTNRDLVSNPQQVYDLDSGLRSDQIDNMPGRQYGVRLRAGVDPIRWLTPPAMGSDVWRAQAWLQQELQTLGGQTGLQMAQRVGRNSSARLVEELRFEDDRSLGDTMRRAAEELGRMVDDWRGMYQLLYTGRTILRYTGEDQAARTLVLLPEILGEGNADVVPDIESMVPEGRSERRQRAFLLWTKGAFGPPTSPVALRAFHEATQLPGMGARSQPGGVHRAKARQENAAMLQGQAAVPHPWDDFEAHLDEHELFMETAEFDRLPQHIQAVFVQHWQLTLAGMAQKQQQMRVLAAAAQAPPPVGAPGPAGPTSPAPAGPPAATPIPEGR